MGGNTDEPPLAPGNFGRGEAVRRLRAKLRRFLLAELLLGNVIFGYPAINYWILETYDDPVVAFTLIFVVGLLVAAPVVVMAWWT